MHRSILLTMLALLLLAGCSTPGPAPEAAPSPPSQATGSANATYQHATLASKDLVVSAAAGDTLQLMVPAGARNVTVRGTFTQANMNDFKVAISGCGTADYSAIVAATVLGSIGPIDACATPMPGAQTATVSVTGEYQGSVTIDADVPA
ncbi:MAG: hypothetical protein V4510_03325 [bacterium]